MALNRGAGDDTGCSQAFEHRQPLCSRNFDRQNNSSSRCFLKSTAMNRLDTQSVSPLDLQNSHPLTNIFLPVFMSNEGKENKPPLQPFQFNLLPQPPAAFQSFKAINPINHPTSSTAYPNASSSSQLYSPFRYQLRRPVESWKYKERKNEDGLSEYLCSICSAVYKHKKSLNKHYKDKHSSGEGENTADETDESYTESSFEASAGEAGSSRVTSMARRPPISAPRLSLRRLPSEHSSQVFKRRKSEMPVIDRENRHHHHHLIDAHPSNPTTEPNSGFASPPLDLSVPKSSSYSLKISPSPLPPLLPREYKEEEIREEEIGHLKDRQVLTLLIQSALTSLKNEPDSAKTTDTISENTFNLLRSVGTILVSSTKSEPTRHCATQNSTPMLKQEQRDLLESQSQDDQLLIPCPYCPLKSRWFSELRAHIVNHSDHRMFGCCYCGYKAKWKWDVTKHMRRCTKARHVAHLPNSRLVRMVTFDPPPFGDLLCTYFSQEGLPGVGVEVPLPRPASESTDEDCRPLAIDDDDATRSSTEDSNVGPNGTQRDLKSFDPDALHSIHLKLTVKRCAACNMHFQNPQELQAHIESKHPIPTLDSTAQRQ